MISTQLKKMYDTDFSESPSSRKLAMSVEDQGALAYLKSSVWKKHGH